MPKTRAWPFNAFGQTDTMRLTSMVQVSSYYVPATTTHAAFPAWLAEIRYGNEYETKALSLKASVGLSVIFQNMHKETPGEVGIMLL
jgi:hypothetical protein